jgi:hypothetical protein
VNGVEKSRVITTGDKVMPPVSFTEQLKKNAR